MKQTLEELYSPINPELKVFSEILKKELDHEDPLIQDIHQHLLKMTGKYLRPALAIFSSKLGDHSQKAMRLATAIELIHTATLVHDDIIDGSSFRRNQPSVYSKWGREISIVSGDYLYAKAFMMIAELEDVWFNRMFALCAHKMCEGEMKQIENRTAYLMSEADYLDIIHSKTAALFQAACAGGAYLGGLKPQEIERLSDFGFRLGMGFQIVDDCLDLIADHEVLGKKAGLDLDQRDVTLPILYLFADLSESERREMLERLESNDPTLFEHIKQLAFQKKSIDRAIEKAREYIQGGIEALGPIRDSAYRDSLIGLSQYCLDRVYTQQRPQG